MHWHYLGSTIDGVEYSAPNSASSMDRWRLNVMSKVHEERQWA